MKAGNSTQCAASRCTRSRRLGWRTVRRADSVSGLRPDAGQV